MPRRTFFSFHYQPDVWRAWNVRNSWVLQSSEKESRGFFDSSVFEATKRESEAGLKAFLREGLKNTSVTCVLAGESTWTRRWVRYEIVRSVLKGNGLLVVDIHGVKNKDGQVAVQGANPLDAVGLYKADDRIFFAEWTGGKWVKYGDYSSAVPAGDLAFAAPADHHVVALANHYNRYDYAAERGRDNISDWIETAARLAGC